MYEKHACIYTHIHIYIKCFAIELAGQKGTWCNSVVQIKAFWEKFILNTNVSERENRFALFSAGQLKCKALRIEKNMMKTHMWKTCLYTYMKNIYLIYTHTFFSKLSSASRYHVSDSFPNLQPSFHCIKIMISMSNPPHIKKKMHNRVPLYQTNDKNVESASSTEKKVFVIAYAHSYTVIYT